MQDLNIFPKSFVPIRLSNELERFFRLTLTDREREDILWNNAMRFLNVHA